MDKVKRYLMNWNMQEAYEYPAGDYVKAPDFDALQARADALASDNERLHKVYPDERRRSIDFHNAICAIQAQQRVWLMRLGAKYGDSTDLKLFDELRRRDSENSALRAQLKDAATSLETISRQAGRDEGLKCISQVRGYADSRARVTREFMDKQDEEGATHE